GSLGHPQLWEDGLECLAPRRLDQDGVASAQLAREVLGGGFLRFEPANVPVAGFSRCRCEGEADGPYRYEYVARSCGNSTRLAVFGFFKVAEFSHAAQQCEPPPIEPAQHFESASHRSWTGVVAVVDECNVTVQMKHPHVTTRLGRADCRGSIFEAEAQRHADAKRCQCCGDDVLAWERRLDIGRLFTKVRPEGCAEQSPAFDGLGADVRPLAPSEREDVAAKSAYPGGHALIVGVEDCRTGRRERLRQREFLGGNRFDASKRRYVGEPNIEHNAGSGLGDVAEVGDF